MTDLSSLSDDQLDAMIAAAQAPVSSAILGQESGNNPDSATSVNGAVGQAQITPATFAQYAKPGEKIDNANDNLAVHQRIIDDLSKKANGDPARIAVGYFSGPGNIAPPDSATPWKIDHKDGNGKTVSSYVGDVTKRLQTADSGDIKTDAQVDSASANPLTNMSDEDLDKAIAAAQASPVPAITQAATTQPEENDYSVKGYLKQMGQSVKSGIQDVKDLFNKDTWTGKNIAEGSPASQKLQSDAVQGNYMNIPMDIIKRTNEAFAGNPAGKVLGAVGGIAGAPIAPAVNASTDLLEKAGVPKDVTQFAMNASPLLMKGLDADRASPAVTDPLAQKLSDLGVKLNKTSLNGGMFSKTLASTTKEIPGSGAEHSAQAAQESLNKAIGATIGQSDAAKITPEVFNKAQEDTGAKYDALQKGATMTLQPQHVAQLADIQKRANDFLPGDQAQAVNGLVNKFFDDVDPNGTIPGEKLGAWRTNLSKGLKGPPSPITPYIGDLRDAVMDMTTVGDPVKEALLKQANQEWRNQKAIEPVVAKAQATDGNISPALLRGAVGQKYNLAKGEGGDLGTLANGAYRYIREPLANSGTGRNLMTKAAIMEPIAAAAWALASGDTTPLLSSVGSIGATVGAARGFNKWNNNPTGVSNLLQGRPNSYSAIRLHPANVSGVSANQQTDRN